MEKGKSLTLSFQIFTLRGALRKLSGKGRRVTGPIYTWEAYSWKWPSSREKRRRVGGGEKERGAQG